MRFITIYPAVLLAALAAAAVADSPLSVNEQHRLAVYCSYVVATHEGIVGPDGGGGSTYKAGDTCPECRGAGEVGDGVVMMKCIYNEDGLYCNKGKLAASGSADFGSSSCDCDCGCEGKCGGNCDCKNCNCCKTELDELWAKLEEKAKKRFNESDIRDLGDQLRRALEESQTLKAGGCKPQECKEGQPTPPPPPSIQTKEDVAPLTSINQTRWNWQGVGNPPLSVKRKHLINEHNVDPDSVNKMSDAEIEALHNLLHNSEVRAAAPSQSRSSSSCPGGNCPTSRSSSASRRRGLFGRFR